MTRAGNREWIVVDAHEDIAWNRMLFGRDIMLPVSESRERERTTSIPDWVGETMLGIPEYLAGNVSIVFATLFLTPVRWQHGEWERIAYADEEEAHQAYVRQLEEYRTLFERFPDVLVPLESNADLSSHLNENDGGSNRVGLVLAMEGGDAIREPSEVGWWQERGVRIVGPAWSGTKYAGGTHEPGPLTTAGRELLARMAEHDLILDISHMTDEGVHDALDRYPHSIIASHANPRALLPGSAAPERHLSDDAIRGIAKRDGVIGIVLYNPFLKDGWRRGHPRNEVTLDHVATAMDYICQLLGDAEHVGIGSDFDGCLGLDSVPAGLDSVADLRFIGDTLVKWGYDHADVEAVLGMNWLRLLQRALPEG